MRNLGGQILFVIALLPSVARVTQSQTRLQVEALREVVHYRQYFMNDTTKIYACSVYAAIGAVDSVGGLPADLVRRLTADARDCAKSRLPWTVFVVDSIEVSDSTALVKATVWRGEYMHLEQFEFKRSDLPALAAQGGPAWFIQRVTLRGSAIVMRLSPGGR